MSDDLTAFLAGRKPNVVDEVEWEMLRLRVSAYLDGECPPMRYITSARAVVMRDEQVLVAEDRDGQRHILPGGRLEAGELPDVALRREIAEETGWQVGDIQPLGFVQYRHLTPKPPDYRYPYPSFVQVIYRTEGTRLTPVSSSPMTTSWGRRSGRRARCGCCHCHRWIGCFSMPLSDGGDVASSSGRSLGRH